MINKDEQVIRKIYNHISAVLKYCEQCSTLDEFQSESMRVEACVFNMMQIGEFAKFSLSDSMKLRIKSIPWNQLYGMRNRIVHGYSGVNMQIVRDTIQEDLPALKVELEKYI